MQKIRNGYWSLMAILALVLGSLPAFAGDTDLTTLVGDAGTLWASVKTVVLSIVVFLVLLGIAKLLKKR